MANNAILAQDLTKRFGNKDLAVDRVSLQVELGEIYGFIGPNGSVKTTTLIGEPTKDSLNEWPCCDLKETQKEYPYNHGTDRAACERLTPSGIVYDRELAN